MGIEKRNIKMLKEEKRTEIKQLQKQCAAAFKNYKTSVENLNKASDLYKASTATLEQKKNGRNKAKHERATEKLKSCENEYSVASMQILGIRKTIERKYEELISVCEATSQREANNERKAFDKFNADIEAKLNKLESNVAGSIPIVSEDEAADLREAEAMLRTERENAAQAPKEEASEETKRVTTTVASVNVAPVTIDISPMVEKAIASAMDKLNAGFERKIAEFYANLQLPTAPAQEQITQHAPADEALSPDADTLKQVHSSISVNNELEEYVLDEEKHIFDKLKNLCSSIQNLLDEMTAVSAEYLNVATKQKEVAELQKQVNDMQRYTLREQQGVQVNQRVVSKDQTEIVAAQTLVVEQQQLLAEQQAAVANAQRAMADTQKAVTETQSTIDKAMKSVLDSQRNLISSQQSIIQSNAKNVEAQKRIVEGTVVISKPKADDRPDAKTLSADEEFR